MTLGELIEALSDFPPDAIIRHGFSTGQSYRGDYADIAFAPRENAYAGEMLAEACRCIDDIMEGYKGGYYRMTEYTTCWIAEWGEAGGQKIGNTLLMYWREDAGLVAQVTTET